MKSPRSLPLVAALLGGGLLLALPERAHSGPDPAPPPVAQAGGIAAEGITVEGSGEATVHADRLEVRTRVSATAEVAGDAFDEYAQLRRRAVEALDAAGIEGLEVRGLGATLAYFEGQDPEEMMGGMVFGPGGPMEADPRVRYREQFVLTVSGSDRLDDAGKAQVVATLLDAAVDSGMELASTAGNQQVVFWGGTTPEVETPAPLVTFRLSDPAEVERRAFAEALAQARRRAADLAELAGVTLGPVRSIEVLSTTEQWQTATSENTCQARLRVVFGFR